MISCSHGRCDASEGLGVVVWVISKQLCLMSRRRRDDCSQRYEISTTPAVQRQTRQLNGKLIVSGVHNGTGTKVKV